MALAPLSISHRSEYGRVARALKQDHRNLVARQVDVFISKGIPRGNEGRPSIEKHLRDGQSLFLIDAAPYDDWSWCFYEVSYFAAVNPAPSDRHIHRLIRPDVTRPFRLANYRW